MSEQWQDGGWALAIIAGKAFVGRLRLPLAATLTMPRLDPAYEWKTRIGPNPQNPAFVEVEMAAMPVEGLLSFGPVDVPPGSIVKAVESLSPLERDRVMATVREGEGIIAHMGKTQTLVAATSASSQGRH